MSDTPCASPPRRWEPREGGCRCGRVRLRLAAPPLLIMACHCRGCQRMTGSAFSLGAAFPAETFAVTRGEPVPPGGLRGDLRHLHCPFCMSWLFTLPQRVEAMVFVRTPMLDDPTGLDPFIETWISEKKCPGPRPRPSIPSRSSRRRRHSGG